MLSWKLVLVSLRRGSIPSKHGCGFIFRRLLIVGQLFDILESAHLIDLFLMVKLELSFNMDLLVIAKDISHTLYLSIKTKANAYIVFGNRVHFLNKEVEDLDLVIINCGVLLLNPLLQILYSQKITSFTLLLMFLSKISETAKNFLVLQPDSSTLTKIRIRF